MPEWGDCDDDRTNGCEQSLRSDPKHCGACGHDCHEGSCENGQCMPVVVADVLQLVDTPARTRFALGATHVFWTEPADSDSILGVVHAASFADLSVQAVADAEPELRGLAASGATSYWLARDPQDQLVLRAGAVGEAPRTVAQLGNWTFPTAPCIAADENAVFVALAPVGSFNYSIYRIARDTGALDILAPSASFPKLLTLSQGHLSWVEAGTGVRTLDLPNGAPRTLRTWVNDTVWPAMAADAVAIYSVEVSLAGLVTLLRIGFDGSVPQVLVTFADQVPDGVAVDSSRIYLTQTGPGTVDAAPLGGGAPRVLVTGQASPAQIGVTDSAIYWLNTTQLMRVAK